MASQLLNKIFDGEMAPLECVPNSDEASLLLRTLQPRLEVVEDDLEARLDRSQDVSELIQGCELNCSCPYIEDLLREHLVVLSKEQKTSLAQKRTPKEVNRCLSFMQSTFCKSEIYQQLDAEKEDFSFEE